MALKGGGEKIKNRGTDKAEKAYRALKKRIFSGYYMPRQHLVEATLKTDLGVNRMTVRDVLKRLVLEGLVVIQPYKGCKVIDISIEDVYETYQVEAVLEGFAAALASEHITPKEMKDLERYIDESKKLDPIEIEKWERYNRNIHQTINRASRSTKLIDLIKDNVKLTNYWFIVLSSPGQIPRQNKEHDRILAAMKKRDAATARQLMESHIMNAAQEIAERFKLLLPSRKR